MTALSCSWWPTVVHQSIKSPLLANVKLCSWTMGACCTYCVDSVQTSGDVLFLRAGFILQRVLRSVWRQRMWPRRVNEKIHTCSIYKFLQIKKKRKERKKKWLPMIHVNKSNWPFEHDCRETQWWRKWNQHHCTVKIAISKWIPHGTISSYMKSDNICQTPTVLATHTLHTTNPLFLSPKHFSSHLTPQTQRRRIQCEQAH